MEIIFQGGDEIVKLVMDRETKKLQVASSPTGYKLIEKPWKMLFDPGQEQVQEALTNKLNDEEFRKAIIMAMAKNGYQLKQ